MRKDRVYETENRPEEHRTVRSDLTALTERPSVTALAVGAIVD